MSAGGGRPPRLARALLDWLLPPSDAGAATGDLDEEYIRYVLPGRGARAASRWYWGQVLRSAPGLLVRKVTWGGVATLFGSLLTDVRHAVRVLRHRPGFATATILTLALAIGVNTTVYSVVDAVLVRPLPFDDADRLVRPIPDALFFMNASEIDPIAERMSTFEDFAAWGRTIFLFTSGGEAEEVRGARVSWNHFDMLGADALIGRTFVRDDAVSDDAVILSHGLWIRRFGGARDVVGSTIDLYGREMTVIGVMSPGHVPVEHDWEAWRTLPLDPDLVAGMGLAANARLRDGATLEQANEELRTVLPEVWAEGGYITSDEERVGLRMVPLDEWLFGEVRQPLVVLAVSVAFLLLLACANVSSLMIAQGGARVRELAVRSALGGSRWRVARQLLVEVGVLSSLGGALALGASWSSLGWFRARLPADLPRAVDIEISGPVVLFALTATLGAALLTGVLPALRGAGRGAASLAGGAQGVSSGSDRARARSALVATEMALAVVLVVGAGLMVRTLISLRAVDPGFDASGVVTFRPSPPVSRYPADPELAAYYERLTESLARIPGVTSVGGIQFLPMTSGGWWTYYLPEGRVLGQDENAPNTAMRVVHGRYFATMRIPVLRGRPLELTDSEEGAEPVAVVNESFESEAFPAGSVIGRTVTVDGTSFRVVGVVGDVKQSDLRTESHTEMYIPFGAHPWRRTHIVVRHEADDEEVVRAIAGAVRALDPAVAVLGPRPMSDVVGGTMGNTHLVTTLLTLFGLVGLGLGAVGVYGVTAQAVAERRREIGIRMALGAASSSVASDTVRSAMLPVALGLAVGLAGAAAGGRILEGLLYGVDAHDVGTLLTAPAVLVLVALLSLTIPAVRASRVDPVRTLREE